jgi:hypothetical protein
MGYELAFGQLEGRDIVTSGHRFDDVDQLWLGEPLDVRYTVANTGDESAPDHYDFLSITDNDFTVEYEDWASRAGFDVESERSFSVPVSLPAGIHWVFVTIDAGRDAPTVAARMVVVASDDTDRMRLLEEARRAG